MKKDFGVFIISFIVAIICIANCHFMQRTREGKFFEMFHSVKQQVVTNVLSGYMRENQIKYTIYKLPNYVVDFIKYDNDFKTAYKSGKYIVLMFMAEDKFSGNKELRQRFYNKVETLVNDNKTLYVSLVRPEITKSHYVLKYDQYAYNDLRSYCANFCIIDPIENTMFIFTKNNYSYLEALDVVFQEYAYNRSSNVE